MKADRLLAILLFLESGRRIPARELAERLEVSERTIYRDLDALNQAGVPVVVERGPGGGCFLLDSYRTDLTGLSFDEARVLLMASGPGVLAELGLGGTLEAAFAKLVAALPGKKREEAQRARSRVHVDAVKWAPLQEETPHLRVLEGAVQAGLRVRISYAPEGGEAGERLVEPYGLIAKSGVWYLAANTPRGMRVYRVSRVLRVDVLDEPFTRPQGFDLSAFWNTWMAEFAKRAQVPSYTARVRVAPEAQADISRLSDGSAFWQPEGGPDAAGWRVGSLRFASISVAKAHLLGFADRVEVLQPEELREELSGAGQRIVALYGSSP